VANPSRSRRAARPVDELTAQRIGGTAAERPRDETHYVAPIALRGAQHVFVSRGRFEPPQAKRVILIKWVIKGECEIGVGGRRISFGPRQAAVYLPTQPHEFWAIADTNELVWFSIDGPLAEQFMRDLELRPGVYPYGAAPVDHVHELMDSLKDPSIQGRRKASLLAIRAIYDLANATRATKTPSAVEQVQFIIQQEFADPDLSSETLAAKVCYHRGSLSRMFHQHTGVTIIDYLTHVRLQEAQTLLKHTDYKVANISQMCGFREPTYFCRWLRKHTGMRPSELRRQTAI
jgi:AraC-like DNA-binding protein